MKKAVTYIRISNKDQSNFSISGQEEYIKTFCMRKEITILNSFLDNGQSAKNFDRADWKKLEDFVKINHKEIDYLVVVKYDRFSRNVAEGLNMIERLEKKYGIAILSVFEEMYVDPKSPFFFKIRADMLVQAEFELRVIKDRTNFGIQQAKREGRWVSKAPYGYINIKENGKPLIVPHFEKASVVRKIFQLFKEGWTYKEIRKEVRPLGFKLKGNSSMTRLLTNPCYAGMIPLSGQHLKGKHEAIIDMETFSRVQAHFSKETKTKVIISDEVPLRGVLKCSCGRLFTAGKSKGKTQYYWYYKCKSHLNLNISSYQVHSKLKMIFSELSLSEERIESARTKLEAAIKRTMTQNQNSLPKLERELKEVENKTGSLEEKFILNQINFDAYSKWSSVYGEETATLRKKIQLMKISEINIWERYETAAGKLTNMLNVYESLTTPNKQRLINLVFNYGLMYRLNSFVTNSIMGVFEDKALKLNEKGLLLINSPSYNLGENASSSGNGSIVELLELLKNPESLILQPP